MGTFTIRNATPQDTGLIYGFILKMARYEKLESEVDTSEEALRRALFDERQAEVVIGEENGIPVGFALFFHNFSTFRGQRGLPGNGAILSCRKSGASVTMNCRNN